MRQKEKDLREKIDTLESSNQSLAESLRDERASSDRLKGDLKKTKNLVRDQTAADMLIVALKACGVIKEEPEPGDKLEDYQRQMDALSSTYASMAGKPNLPYSSATGIFGDLVRP